jgi:hypothetical protein
MATFMGLPVGNAMSVLWFVISVYLVFSLVSVFEAEVVPGPSSTAAEVCLAALAFGLAHPLRAALRRVIALI